MAGWVDIRPEAAAPLELSGLSTGHDLGKARDAADGSRYDTESVDFNMMRQRKTHGTLITPDAKTAH